MVGRQDPVDTHDIPFSPLGSASAAHTGASNTQSLWISRHQNRLVSSPLKDCLEVSRDQNVVDVLLLAYV